MPKRYVALHAEHKYMPEDIQKCPILRKVAGPAARDIVKVSWKPAWEPEDGGVPEQMIKDFDEARAASGHINLARDNRIRADLHKSNLDKQGDWSSLQTETASALLLQPELGQHIDINPMDIINPDQDISACKTFMICKRHGAASSDCHEVANVYAPTGKLCGTITVQRLQILQHAFDESQKQHPVAHAAFHYLSFAQAVACLLSRYEGKRSTDNNKVRLSQHRTIPDEHMRVMC